MIERHITFDVLPDRTDEFEHFFSETYRPPALRMPGLIECGLLRDAETPTTYRMLFRWENPEDAVAWRESEAHQALQPELRSLHNGMQISAFTRVG
jgi:heme-degrading monooxygenase HmoA